MLGARVLGEFGDDPDRYANAKSRRNYAGTSPLTARQARNGRCSPATSATDASTTPSTNGPSARCRPAQAVAPSTTSAETPATSTTKLYGLGNRLVGILHGCSATTQAKKSKSMEHVNKQRIAA